MVSERTHQAEHEAKDKLVAELVRRNEFEVPDSLIERQIDIRLERGLRALAAQGLTAEQMKTVLEVSRSLAITSDIRERKWSTNQCGSSS